MGTKARASQVGRGMRITSVKHVVGRVEELRWDDESWRRCQRGGWSLIHVWRLTKPSGRFVQSIVKGFAFWG